MPVNTLHFNYCKLMKRWELVRRVVDNDAQCYIRNVDPDDEVRSKQYKEDAILTNFTRLTKDGLTGLVFRKAPKEELASSVQYLSEDATGENMSLAKFAQKITGEVLQTGRYGILVDYPPAQDVASLAETEASGNVARLKGYCAEAIINYKIKKVGSKYLVNLIVLKEEVDNPESEDIFDHSTVIQYRVLYLDFAGRYATYTIYEDGKDQIEHHIPLQYNGQPWKEIPFVFIGSENNDPEYDPIPLYDLAVLNVGHYRNSADYEESIFINGQPMGVWAVGGSPETFKAANPNGIVWGSRAGVNVGEGGDGKLLQANPNQLADQAMKRKEEQAAAIGARLIAPPGAGRETAEGVRLRFGSQNSTLYTITSNISLALSMALDLANKYMSDSVTKSVVELNNQFYDDPIDSQTLMMMLQAQDRGAVTKDEIRNYIKDKGGASFLTATDAELEAEAHSLDPLAGVDVTP